MVGKWGRWAGSGKAHASQTPRRRCLSALVCCLSCRYRNSTVNDLSYWGLDYPPLSGYQVHSRGRLAWHPGCRCSGRHPAAPLPWPINTAPACPALLPAQSWLAGKYVQMFEPAALELESSRGYESGSSKMLLRHTVLASDALAFLPAALASAAVFGGKQGSTGYLAVLVGMLFSPAAILIDHGHFQYNCIGLGLAAGGAAAAAAGRDVLGALLFSLSLNHKQMGLYYAPAFFAYLLGKCLQRRTAAGKVRASRQRPALQFFSFCGGYIAFKLD